MALKAMLVSPDFLYIREEKSESERLNSFEIANRLSHFLWSSFPDNDLFVLAKDENCRIGKSSRNRQFDYSMMIAIGRLWKALLIVGYAWISSGLCHLPLKFREYYRIRTKRCDAGRNIPFRF